MSRIAICHFRIGYTDGVSLEIEKWKNVLEKIGHTIYLLAGQSSNPEVTVIPQLGCDSHEINRIYRNSFQLLNDFPSEEALCQEIHKIASEIEEKIYSFLKEFSIELLDIENIWSLPLNIPAAIALYRIIDSAGIKVVSHNHDFFWERPCFNYPTCKVIRDILDNYYPPRHKLINHTVINSLAQDELKKRRGIHSTVIPNILDFEGLEWKADDYNYNFKKALGLNQRDIVILQATRIVPRKGIELAIDLVKELAKPENLLLMKEKGLYDKRVVDKKSRVVLVFPNLIEDIDYFKLLEEKIKEDNINALFINDLVDAKRKIENKRKIYSLWDTYVFADLVSYPSLYEGWGNQLLEAIRAKLPIVLFEYEVYRKDIKPAGFKVISLGNRLIGKDIWGLNKIDYSYIREASQEAIRLLTDLPYRQKIVEHNFSLGKQFYSLTTLREYLEPLFNS